MDVDNGQAAMAASQPLSPHSMDIQKTTEHDRNDMKSALTPPTSEEFNHDVKVENDDSELSELDLSDDEEEVEPDHYWDGGRVPVFKPTMEQFRSFKKYIKKIDKYGMKSGIVKVIPPQEWRDSLCALDEMVKRIKIKNPITQEFIGTFGTYTQQNMEKQRSYNLPEWKALTEETQYQPPARRGERRKNQEKVVRGGGNNTRSKVAKKEENSAPQPKRKGGRQRKGASAEGEEAEKEPKAKRPRGRQGGAAQNRSVTSRRLNNTAEAVDWVDEKAFEGFDYRMDGLDEFTPERCAELESHYWRSLGFNQPMYAADMPGSLFDDSTTSWNVAKLENLLDVLGTKVPGVNTAYLYLGMWKATFAWHLEDVDLYSINYIHFGAPKQWYSISQEDARRFEAAMKSVWPVDFKNCDQFLRHKTYLISPEVLQKQYNVKVNKLVHYEGEFVITYPYGYHSGFNLGYNCAESVNFATESWLDYGRIARKCNCEADNVWVDVAEIERKLRGEPTPEYYEETDDDSDGEEGEDSKLPTPPASVKGQKTSSRKRKRDDKKEVVKKKKKIRIRIKSSTFEPCVMCPNDNPWEPLLPTDTGKKAHRSCATFTPETWIAEVDGIDMVCGVATIDKARLELKCNFCRSKRGAVFQCSSRKCTRAFHATCALAAGVQIDKGPVPTFGEDGTEYFEEGYDFRCKFHRPKMPKNITTEMLENSRRVLAFARDVKPNDVVQAQYIGGEVFAGLVLENRPEEQSLLVEVLPDGDRLELEWKYLSVLNPEESQRPKPSPSAIPMPEGMNKQLVSIGNRQDGVPTQDEPFTTGSEHKWADFRNVLTPPQGFAVGQYHPLRTKVDLDAPDQLYYYLGAISTDAKPFFADVPGSKQPAGRSNFLDRVNPKPVQPSHLHKMPLAAAHSGGSAYRHIFSMTPQPVEQHAYQYKPRPSPFDGLQMLEPQRKSSEIRQSVPSATGSTSSSQNSPSGTPLQPFPPHQYYSHRVLPAAFTEYSGFTKEVRRVSQGAQVLQRPSFDTSQYLNIAPGPPTIGAVPPSALYNNNVESRPPSSAYGQPLTPATTTTSTESKLFPRPQTSLGVAEMLADPNVTQSSHFRSASEHWIPPSRRMSSVGSYPHSEVSTQSMSQALSLANGLAQQTQPRQQQRQQHLSSARAYEQPDFFFPQRQPHQKYSTGQAPYSHNSSWQGSPRAPTPSPISNPHTPRFSDAMMLDDALRAEPMRTGYGLGPMLPQMESAQGVHEAWKSTRNLLQTPKQQTQTANFQYSTPPVAKVAVSSTNPRDYTARHLTRLPPGRKPSGPGPAHDGSDFAQQYINEDGTENSGSHAGDTATAALAQYHTMSIPSSTEHMFAAQASGNGGKTEPSDEQAQEYGGDVGFVGVAGANGDGPPQDPNAQAAGHKPSVGTDEWHKIRRDNHKEVERRRRETINEGINELAKIVPQCEKNKGSILARAVQFITELKKNENENIQKWGLEKMLTEQAITELSGSVDTLKAECSRAWAECEAWKTAAQKAGIEVEIDNTTGQAITK